ncbi:MAG: hypothetical protein KBC17_00150 [Candidatus Pacebacteria bacterium]|nr:hypothetical protein [Candidatus Paceibacterota bacterium]
MQLHNGVTRLAFEEHSFFSQIICMSLPEIEKIIEGLIDTDTFEGHEKHETLLDEAERAVIAYSLKIEEEAGNDANLLVKARTIRAFGHTMIKHAREIEQTREIKVTRGGAIFVQHKPILMLE